MSTTGVNTCHQPKFCAVISCPRCQEGAFLSGEPKGTVGGLLGDSYFSPAPVTKSNDSKTAILVLTDGFGLPLKNCKIIADELAKELECDVWVADYFLGKPLIPLGAMTLADRAGVKISLWKWIKFIFTVGLPNIMSFISNRPSSVDSRVRMLIQQLKEKRRYEKIGVVGYCYGGSTCIRFASRPDLVNSAVICHPGAFTIQDIRKVKVPTAWACAEDDVFFSNALRDNSEAELASRKGKENFVEYEFKVYKGTAHGFASRPTLELPEVKAAYEGALKQTVNWFKKTLY